MALRRRPSIRKLMEKRRTEIFEPLNLTDYEQTVLQGLISSGRTTAPNLAESTGVPKARIYGVLESLAEKGFIKVVPGRPKEYHPKPPEEILDRAIENNRQDFQQIQKAIESIRESFVETLGPKYDSASEEISPAEELFYVVDVGDPSERETRAMYHDAGESVFVLTKGFEYFDRIEQALLNALRRDISVYVLFLNPTHLTPENQSVQSDVIERIRTEYPQVKMAFSEGPLPWRGTFIDPSMDYDSGRAIILVGERQTPLRLRKAAITENGSFVAGLKRFFDLVWEFDSEPIEE